MNLRLLTSNRQEWETPQLLFDKLNSIYDFTLDVASTVENAKCTIFFTKKDDGLIKKWDGKIWCHPPYNNVGAWIAKAYCESLNNPDFIMAMLLIPARTDTKAWHDYIFGHKHVTVKFLKGRLKFSNSKNSAHFQVR